MPLTYATALILTLCLIALSLAFIAWWLYKNFMRVITTETQHLELRQRAEEMGGARERGEGQGEGQGHGAGC